MNTSQVCSETIVCAVTWGGTEARGMQRRSETIVCAVTWGGTEARGMQSHTYVREWNEYFSGMQ